MAAGPFFAVCRETEYLGRPGWRSAGQEFLGHRQVLVEIRNLDSVYRATDNSHNPAALHVGLGAGAKLPSIFGWGNLAYDLFLQHLGLPLLAKHPAARQR